MRSLIINADDFGMSAEINEGIMTGIESGLVTSVSLLVNMPFFDDAVEFLRRHKEVSAGLHFNATEGTPVLLPSEVDSLLKEDNTFFSWMGLLPQLISRSAKIDHLHKELLAQYQKLENTGIKITHIDSHHHIHLYPPIFKFFTQLADEKGIESLRCRHFNIWGLTAGIKKRPKAKQLLIDLGLWLNGLAHNHRHFSEVSGIYDVNWDANLTEDELIGILNSLPEGKTELICHLGVVSPTGNKRFLEPRLKALELLQSPNFKAQLLKSGIKLVNYQNS